MISEADFDAALEPEAIQVEGQRPAGTPPAPPAAVPAPQAQAAPEPEPEAVAEAAPPVPEPAKRKASPQARINEAIRKQRDAERQAAEWQARYNEALAVAQSNQPVRQTHAVPQEPTFDQFSNEPDPYLAYTRAVARFTAEQAARAATEGAIGSYQERGRAAQHVADLQALKATTPNFDELMAVANAMPINPQVRAAILDSDQSARLVLYFAENPEEYDALLGKSGFQLVRALGQIEGRLDTAHSGSVSTASAPRPAITPIQPVGTSPVSTAPNVDDMEFGPEYIRLQNKRDAERRKLHF